MTKEEIAELKELLFRQSSYVDDDGMMEMLKKHLRYNTFEKKHSRAVELLNKFFSESEVKT